MVRIRSMATGARGEKRPGDALGRAVMIGRVAAGEIVEKLRESSGKVRSGLAGAKARAENMSAEGRSAAARKVAGARWGS